MIDVEVMVEVELVRSLGGKMTEYFVYVDGEAEGAKPLFETVMVSRN